MAEVKKQLDNYLKAVNDAKKVAKIIPKKQ